MRTAYNICTSKFLLSHVEHVVELIPHNDISLDEDRSGLGGVIVDELLCKKEEVVHIAWSIYVSASSAELIYQRRWPVLCLPPAIIH
jgi:hypothetical protein